MRFRKSEWILISYFVAIATVSLGMHNRRENGAPPVVILSLVVLTVTILACGERYWFPRVFSFARDWCPIYLTLTAFRELDWFTPVYYTSRLEQSWMSWDYFVLSHLRLSSLVNSFGAILPDYLELSYLLVYAVSSACLTILYLAHRRRWVDDWLVVYLIGTLAAYLAVPFFPSRPPRIAFPGAGPEPVLSALRRFNLFILNSSSIHAGVFPSAHVSSVFSAAWGLLIVLPQRRRYGLAMLGYACSVSVATLYGRYHYVADTAAGFGISLVAGAIGWMWVSGERSRNGDR